MSEFRIDIPFQIARLLILDVFWLKLKRFELSKFMFQIHRIDFIDIWMSFEFNRIESKGVLDCLKVRSVRNCHRKSRFNLDIVFDCSDIFGASDVSLLRECEFRSDDDDWDDWNNYRICKRHYIEEIRAWCVRFNWFCSNENLFIQNPNWSIARINV